jgi:hypothetical protein
MVKFSILFEVRTDFLNIIYRSFGFKGLKSLRVVITFMKSAVKNTPSHPNKNFIKTILNIILATRIKTEVKYCQFNSCITQHYELFLTQIHPFDLMLWEMLTHCTIQSAW